MKGECFLYEHLYFRTSAKLMESFRRDVSTMVYLDKFY